MRPGQSLDNRVGFQSKLFPEVLSRNENSVEINGLAMFAGCVEENRPRILAANVGVDPDEGLVGDKPDSGYDRFHFVRETIKSSIRVEAIGSGRIPTRR